MNTPLNNRLKKLENRLIPVISQKNIELCEKIKRRRLKVFGEEECRIRDAFNEKYPVSPSNDLALNILNARKRLPLFEKFKAEYMTSRMLEMEKF